MPSATPPTQTKETATPVSIYTAKSKRTLNHPKLVDLLQKAYSAEKAAAFAYQGHAASVKDPEEKAAIRQIEIDEWNHRREVLAIMHDFDIPVSRWYEARFYAIGKAISASCHVIGWFMPFFFAGKLESGNVCEYFRAKQYFNSLGIRDYDVVLYDMGIKEKEHEVYFLEKIRGAAGCPSSSGSSPGVPATAPTTSTWSRNTGWRSRRGTAGRERSCKPQATSRERSCELRATNCEREEHGLL